MISGVLGARFNLGESPRWQFSEQAPHLLHWHMGMWVCLRASVSTHLKKAEHWSLPFYVLSGLAHPLLPTMSKAEKSLHILRIAVWQLASSSTRLGPGT
jgi:hypothetical protein